MQDLPRFVAPLLIGSALVACSALKKQSSGRDEADEAPLWACRRDPISDRCSCNKPKPGWVSDFRFDSTELQCQSYRCCLLTESETQSTSASCECYDDGADCQAEASSRRATRVVSQCPPSEEVPVSTKACAQLGENCRTAYLSQNDLSGCCEGSLCEANGAGVRVCREASEDEAERARECEKGARTIARDALRISDGSLNTSAGTVVFNAQRFPQLEVGPGGCLRGLSIDLTAGGPALCSFRLDVKEQNGRLSVVKATGLLYECPGYTPAPLAGIGTLLGNQPPPAVDFAFTAVSCEKGSSIELYCLAGHFDFHFHGAAGDITVEDDHLTLDGVLCSSLPPSGACPQL